MNKDLTINMVRHGEAKYGQLEVPINLAYDLTEKGITDVSNSFLEISTQIDKDEPTLIWSSPMGRTLHTAKIGKDVLEKKLGKPVDIQIVPELAEAKNFEWKFFQPLVVGGIVELNGNKYDIDAKITNPAGLDYDTFFGEDMFHHLPQEARDKLPADYLKRVESFEPTPEVRKRSYQIIEEAEKVKDVSRLVMTTHDAIIGPFVKRYTQGAKSCINPAGYITFQRREGKLDVVNVRF